MADQHFLVVGGTRGTGRALVRRLSGVEGNRVSVVGRNPAPDADSPKVAQFAVDVSDSYSLKSSLDQAVARFGKLTCVIFMQRHRGATGEFDMELTVALNATKEAIDHIVGNRWFSETGQSNSIVLVSSVIDHYIAPDQSLGYHVAKAGLSHMARFYALELGPAGIRVNSVSPCMVAKEEAKDFYEKNSWLVDRFRKYIPLGRMGRSEDIVNVIMFLASAQASYITGQNIVVDGGMTLRSHESLIRDFPHPGAIVR